MSGCQGFAGPAAIRAQLHNNKLFVKIVKNTFLMPTGEIEYKKDGYLVLENFFTEKEVQEMKEAGEKLTEDIPDEKDRVTFNDSVMSRDKYFLESSDKIRYFFEAKALDENGKLLVDPKVSVQKVAHALHWLHPVFRKYTFCERIKELCDKILDLEEPRVIQSMYIYKNQKIGGEADTHQDSTYLYTKPEDRLVGFWIALDDATTENGCLWFAPGSHNSGVHTRLIRNPDKDSEERLIYTSPKPFYSNSNFVAVPVRKGTLILIHGLVLHRSDPNRSDKSRHVYTFHVADLHEATYSDENWLQPSEAVPFPNIYENS